MRIRMGSCRFLLFGLFFFLLLKPHAIAQVRWDVVGSPTEVINTGRSEVTGSITLYAHENGAVTGTAVGGDAQIAVIYDQPSVEIDNTTSTGIKLVFSPVFTSGTAGFRLRILTVENFQLNGRCTGRVLINIPGGITVQAGDFIRLEGVRGRIDRSLAVTPGSDLFVSLQSFNDPAANAFNPDRLRVSKSFDGLSVKITTDTLEICKAPTGKPPGVDPSYSITVTEGFARAFVDADPDTFPRVDDLGMALGAPTNSTKLEVRLRSIPASVEQITWPALIGNAGAQSSLRLVDSNFVRAESTASAVYSFEASSQTNSSDIYIESFTITPVIQLETGSIDSGDILASVSLAPFAGSLADCVPPDSGSARPAFLSVWESDSTSVNNPPDDPPLPLASITSCSCTYLLEPTSASFPSTGGSGSILVTTSEGCNWTAVSNSPWITVTSGMSGAGNGTIQYKVDPDVGPSRQGTLTIADQTFTVTQVGERTHWETIDVQGADATSAFAINPHGDIAGKYTAGGVGYGFVMSRGIVKTVDYQDPATLTTWVEGISPQGTAAGTYSTPGVCENCPSWITGDCHGFVWKAGTFDVFNVPNASYTYATGINARGEVVGEYMRDGKVYGFIRDGKGFTTIDVSESPDTLSWCAAYGINAKSEIAGWYGHGGTRAVFHGYILAKGRLTTIDGPDSTWTLAHGINSNGDVVGWYFDTGATKRGFLWSGGTLHTIDIPDATWTACEGINDQGDIVGSYGTEDGKTHGFVLYK